MFKNLGRLFFGYIEGEARGFGAERFLSLAAYRGICLWHIKRERGTVVFKAGVKDFRTLCTLARKSGVRLRLTGRRGRPFFVHKYRRRYVFAAGGVIFAFLLIFMCSFIWLIEPEGNQTISDYEILELLSRRGFKTGAFKYTADTIALEEYLKRELDNVSWVNVKIEGTRAKVTIAENIRENNINQVDNFSPCDIIADKEALITDIIATAGKPSVRSGDVVRPGDILISGDITYLKDGEETPFARVYASGRVRGKVERSFSCAVPQKIPLKRYTQNIQTSYNIKIFNTAFGTDFLKKEISFENYDIIRETKQLSLGERFALPIFTERVSLREYKTESLALTEEEARRLGESQINKQLITEYPTGWDILKKDLTFTRERGSVNAEARVTAIEDIGKISYIEPMENIQSQGGNAVNGATKDTNSE